MTSQHIKIQDPEFAQGHLYTLAFLAGHSDFSTTKRDVHPQIDTVRKVEKRLPQPLAIGDQ